MEFLLSLLQIVVSVLLVVSVLFQSRGSSVGMAFGGTGETYRSKKGIEKILFYATIVLSIIFACISILMIVLQ